jgi:predicted HNH restriction endonuclease
MLTILWTGSDAKGFTDIIPPYLFADDGFRKSIEHQVRGPRAASYPARCSVLVQREIVTFDYGGDHQRFNIRHDNDRGIMKVIFTTKSRRVVADVLWKDEDASIFVSAAVVATLREYSEDAEEISEIEGGARLVSHMRRERAPGLRNSKIADARRAGALRCEACNFDFERAYGDLGDAACEVHHRASLAATGETTTKLTDLAILCANCHRVIHRTDPLLDVSTFTKRISN